MYFGVDSDPFIGLLRALSIVTERPVTADDSSNDVAVYIDQLHKVLHHGEGQQSPGDSHRFTLPTEQNKTLSMV